MTATHNALLGALSKYSHFDEFSEYLKVHGNILTPAQRTALARSNLGLPPGVYTASAAVTPGAGITDGVGTVVSSQKVVQGDKITTRIFIDLTGLASSTTDLDVIGTGTSAAYLGQITAALHGSGVQGTMLCLETPAGGADDIDLYSATVGTAKFDDGIAALTETALITSGGAWVAGIQKNIALAVPANDYLYLCGGEAGTAATYTAGRFVIELVGYTFTGT